ncbi:MAG: beta-xylosidase [Chloroflexi bacterium]|nr:beta-xylosidase [Chloroflexota bacterium]
MVIEFFVDPSSSGSPFPHYWEQCVGSCHAVMGLRSDWRQQLEKSHRELGFQYVRFHGLLDDDMNICMREYREDGTKGQLRFSFYSVDSIYDFLLSIGMKPFIELGFMPSVLASGTATCFHYKANTTPPADYGEWEALIRALTQHLVDRYGLEEVRTWFFEVWNEPNLSYFWAGTKEEYFRIYEHAVRAIKSVDSQLRVGGPATSVNSWLPDMLDFCRSAGVPIDFLSTHHYPTDDPLWRHSDISGEEVYKQFAHEFGKYERGVLRKMTARAREQAGDMPLYYTEWNTSAWLTDSIHDDAFSAALAAKTIADNDGLVQGYSWWTFSDLFEEGGQYAAPFHGGFGLQNIHGIPKPTYRAFEMLHALGDERLAVSGGENSSVEILAVRDGSTLMLLAYNHVAPGQEIRTEDVAISLKGITPGTKVAVARVDQESANPKQKWIDLGSPEYPTLTQLAEIEQASRPRSEEDLTESAAGGSMLRFALPPHGIAALTVKTPTG